MKIFHNPRCSKSREALKLLQDHGVEPEVVLYLETPPTVAELEQLCQALDQQPPAILRFKEIRAVELGLKPDDTRARSEWLGLLASNPKLLERPIVIKGKRAVVGRPPERVLTLLD